MCACTVLIMVRVTVITDCSNVVLSATDWCVRLHTYVVSTGLFELVRNVCMYI